MVKKGNLKNKDFNNNVAIFCKVLTSSFLHYSRIHPFYMNGIPYATIPTGFQRSMGTKPMFVQNG